MIDAEGVEWLPVRDAAHRLGIKPGTVYVWIHRQRVQAHRISGRAYVNMADTTAAEYEMRMREGA